MRRKGFQATGDKLKKLITSTRTIFFSLTLASVLLTAFEAQGKNAKDYIDDLNSTDDVREGGRGKGDVPPFLPLRDNGGR